MTRHLFWTVKFSFIHKGNREEVNIFKHMVEDTVNKTLRKIEKDNNLSIRSLQMDVMDTE